MKKISTTPLEIFFARRSIYIVIKEKRYSPRIPMPQQTLLLPFLSLRFLLQPIFFKLHLQQKACPAFCHLIQRFGAY